jgi:hypothetical protein
VPDDRNPQPCYRFRINIQKQKAIMLITFTSKASAEVLMYKEHAKRILDLLGKDADRGVITAAEASGAVAVLEKEIAENRMHHTSDDVQRDVDAHQDKDSDHESAQSVSFATRAYPLLEMLRDARDQQADVLWGV